MRIFAFFVKFSSQMKFRTYHF